MKKCVRVLAALLCALLLASCGAKPDPGPTDQNLVPPDHEESAGWTALTVKDDLDREVTLETQPQRVVVLAGSFADTWLLAGGRMVATVDDAWDDLGLDLGDDVVNLGSSKDVNLELLFGTEPDLVIASSNTKSHVEIKDTLEGAKVNVLYFDVNGFEDYLRMLKVCTDITGRADLYEANGLKVQEQVEAAKTAAAAAVEEQGAPRVLLLRAAASGVHAKGSKGTVLGLMLADLGCVNISDGSDLLDELSLEKIIEEDPDRIFIVQQGDDDEGTRKALSEALTGNPAWSGLTAVREGRVHIMDKNLYHFKPNARWGMAYEQLEVLLYGE